MGLARSGPVAYHPSMTSISDNVTRVRDRVAASLARSGRADDDVTIVAVTKTFGHEVVEEVIAAGIVDIGENRVQEFVPKREAVKGECRWHLIGHLQRNKASKVVGAVHMIQSVDSIRLAETVDRLGRERGVVTPVLVEVNTSGEASKEGVTPEEASDVVARIAELGSVAVEGLMTIGPVGIDPVVTRRCFQQLYGLREQIRAEAGLALPHLSMGMSGDFEMAIEEGSTIIRVGRVITGDRSR
jgi:pyridoxal phosphate enzyme (YggS family)